MAHERVRIGLEKPLGSDLETSRQINEAVAAAFPEERTFRIDHCLGKETVQNLLALRFANAMFEPLWNAHGIDHVQITVSETVGLEGRNGFYEDTGALRDMVQNHMLQLLALTAMEPPADYYATAIRNEKVKVLRALRAVQPAEMVRGQYGAGAVGGQAVAGFSEDLGEASGAETFVAIKAHVDNWRWQGVPLYLRTGKRLAERRSEIVVQFKGVPHNIFAARGGRLTANRLTLSCGNLAHGFAAAGEDKAAIRRGAGVNIAIVTAYNGMLSAHQPYGRYPEQIKLWAREVGATAQIAGGVPAMCDGLRLPSRLREGLGVGASPRDSLGCKVHPAATRLQAQPSLAPLPRAGGGSS